MTTDPNRPTGDDAGPARAPAEPDRPDDARPARAAAEPDRPDDAGPAPDPMAAARSLIETWSKNVLGSLDRLVSDIKTDTDRIRREGNAFGAALMGRVLPLVNAARATPRAARIAREAGILFGAYRLDALRAKTLTPEAARAERDALDRRSAARAAELCTELRGALLKLGQFASTRRDLLPPAWIAELSRLQDAVPPVPFEGIAARIEAELGAPPDERFAHIDPTPIAAASLAQVHAATLPDGTPVAVKVLVPGVEAEVEGDLALFSILAGGINEIARGFDVATAIEELSRSVRAELDYQREADAAAALAADLAGDPRVLVPRIHTGVSSRRVLTMERIEGRRLTAFLEDARARGDAGAADRDRVLSALVSTYAAQILTHGRFQADPHPGNFLVCEDGRLALLDFGAVETLAPAVRRDYARLIGAVLARDRARTGEVLADLGFRTRDGGDPEALTALAEALLDSFRASPDQPLAELDPRVAFEEALALARRARIVTPEHFVHIGRVLSALAGLLLSERPRIELFALIAPHLAAAGASASAS